MRQARHQRECWRPSRRRPEHQLAGQRGSGSGGDRVKRREGRHRKERARRGAIAFKVGGHRRTDLPGISRGTSLKGCDFATSPENRWEASEESKLLRRTFKTPIYPFYSMFSPETAPRVQGTLEQATVECDELPPRGGWGAMFYPRLADGGGQLKSSKPGCLIFTGRGERCVVHLPLGASVSRSVPQGLFCALCQCQFQMLSRSPEISYPIPHA